MNSGDRKARLNDIRRVAASMQSAPIEAPDLMGSILDRVDAERAFLAPSVRKKLPIVRWSIIGGMACLALTGALLLRFAPSTVQVVEPAAPLSVLVRTVESRADVPLANIRATVKDVVKVQPVQMLNAVVAVNAVSKADLLGSGEVIGGTGSELSSTPMQLTGGMAGQPAFVGPIMPMQRAMDIAAARAELKADRSPRLTSMQASLLATDPLNPSLESSVVPSPRRSTLPALLDSTLDMPSIR